MKFAIIILYFFYHNNSDGSVCNKKKIVTTSNKSTIHSFNDNSTKQTVLGFLNWYKINQERLKKINVVDGIPGDSTKYYAINFEKVNEFLSEIKRSGFISNNFETKLMTKFKKCDANLKIHPQFDGPVEELEYDIVFGVQEQDDITQHLKEIRILSKSNIGKKSSILFSIGKYLRLKVYLTKYSKKWLIDRLHPYYI